MKIKSILFLIIALSVQVFLNLASLAMEEESNGHMPIHPIHSSTNGDNLKQKYIEFPSSNSEENKNSKQLESNGHGNSIQTLSYTNGDTRKQRDEELAFVNSEEGKNTEPTTLRLRKVIHKAIDEINENETLVKLEEVDPSLINIITLKYPKLKVEEPQLVLLLLPRSLKIEYEERPKEKSKEKKKKSKGEILQNKLDKILRAADSKLEESTALLSYKRFPGDQKKDDNQPKWDDQAKFIEELDRAFFNPQNSSCGLRTGKILAGIAGGLSVPIPLGGVILIGMSKFFSLPPGGGLAISLASWLDTTVSPVSARLFYKRIGKIFEKEDFISLQEDERLAEANLQKTKKRLLTELLNDKKEGETLTSEERQQITKEAQEEVGEPYRSKPHIFKKSNKHKFALVSIAISSTINALIPALLIIDTYEGYDRVSHFPWGYLFATPVGLYYAFNYYDFGSDNLWNLFSHYSYIGTGQTCEEDSREKRRILIERIRQFQGIIADAKYDKYVEAVYKAVLEQKSKLKSHPLTEEDDISALSLLMLKDKLRIDEQSESFARAANFKRDLDVIKVSWKDDLLDRVTAGIVGAGFFADTEIVRYTLEKIFRDQFGLDPVTSAELAGFYATSFLDVSLRAGLEFNLHQNNFKSWLKTFSLKHLVDFQWLRKSLGGPSTINGIFHSFPKLAVGWAAFQGYPLLGKLALLIPSSLNNFSLNQAIFDKHYNGIVTDAATLRTGENISISRKRAHLKAWSDKAILLIGTRFDDETIDKTYGGIHEGM